MAYAQLGAIDLALTRLEEAYEPRDFWMVWLKVQPEFDPLRAEPRVQRLWRSVANRGDPSTPVVDAAGTSNGKMEFRRKKIVRKYARLEAGESGIARKEKQFRRSFVPPARMIDSWKGLHLAGFRRAPMLNM